MLDWVADVTNGIRFLGLVRITDFTEIKVMILIDQTLFFQMIGF